MRGTVRQLASHFPLGWGRGLSNLLLSLADRSGNRVVNAPGLAIKAGSSAIVKAGNAFDALISDGNRGKLVIKAANTDMAALVGTVANATHNVFCFFIDRAGTLTSAMGIAAAAVGDVKFPPIPEGKAMIGYVRINPTGTGDFVGGTTALDDGTVAPGALYRDTHGFFDPTFIA